MGWVSEWVNPDALLACARDSPAFVCLPACLPTHPPTSVLMSPPETTPASLSASPTAYLSRRMPPCVRFCAFACVCVREGDTHRKKERESNNQMHACVPFSPLLLLLPRPHLVALRERHDDDALGRGQPDGLE